MKPQLEFVEQAGELVLKACHGGPHAVEIPAGVTLIGAAAFQGQRQLERVTIPAGVREIGARAFQKCGALAEIDLPAGLATIGVEAFDGCTALGEVRFAQGLREIKARAFWHCRSLQALTLPQSIERIGPRAFDCCGGLRAVNIGNPGAFVDEYAFNETPYCNHLLKQAALCTAKQDGAARQEIPAHLELPEGLTHIDIWAYSKSPITSAWLPSSLRTIGMCAFKDCPNLREVSMSPNSYCNYGLKLAPEDGIFANCPSLEQVTFRGPLKDYTWSGAAAPELLHGCDRARTFQGCVRLRRIVAWQVPFAAIPREWRQYALNGFLADLVRDAHYAPEVARAYHAYCRANRQLLLNRTKHDHSYALHQYLIEQRLIEAADFDALLARASAAQATQTTAALLAYQQQVLRGVARPNQLAEAWAELDA